MKKNKLNTKKRFSLESRVLERINSEKLRPTAWGLLTMQKISKISIVFAFFLLASFFFGVFFTKITIAKILGISFIMQNLPWFSVGLGFSFFLLTFAFIEKFKLLYKLSLTTLFLILFMVTSVTGFVFHKANFAKSQRTLVKSLYNIDGELLQISAGNIVEMRTDKSFVFRSVWGVKSNVYLSSETHIPQEKLEVDDSILLIGVKSEDIFIAKGIVLLSRAN